MDIYKLKFTRLQNEIFRLLCIKTQELNQRRIAKLLRVSPTAVSKSIKELEKEELILIEKDKLMNLNSITLNTDNPETIALKRIENLKLIYESKIVNFLEEKFPGTTIILFGSYSRGEDTNRSDIDIAIIGSKAKELNLTTYDKKLERTITIHNYENINKLNKELKSNILNGIVISGAVEL